MVNRTVVNKVRRKGRGAPDIGLLDDLETKISYKFKDISLLELALTHRSLTSTSNERLEFLGDVVFNLVVSDYLYTNFPDAQEGRLSRVRARIVSRVTLQKVAARADLIAYLKVGPAENRNLDHLGSRTSIVSDALEAIIGAVYVDGGLEAARGAVMELFGQELVAIDINALYKDYKTQLQELVQSSYHSVPAYNLEEEKTLRANAREFLIHCTVPHHADTFVGKGANRKEAEQNAARAALGKLTDKLTQVE